MYVNASKYTSESTHVLIRDCIALLDARFLPLDAILFDRTRPKTIKVFCN